MSGTTARNIGIVLLLAVVVYAVPGGGTAAAMVSAFISIAFAVAIWLFLMRMYRENRSTIFGLGDQYRGFLYFGLASILLLGASAGKWFDSAPLTLLWFVVLGAAIAALVATFRHWRAYD